MRERERERERRDTNKREGEGSKCVCERENEKEREREIFSARHSTYLLVHNHIQVPMSVPQIRIPQSKVHFGKKFQARSQQVGFCGEQTQLAALIASRKSHRSDDITTFEAVFSEYYGVCSCVDLFVAHELQALSVRK